MAGEFEFIEWVRKQHRAGGAVKVGVGDDLAVVDWPAGDLLLVGVDQVLDGVHFDSAVHSPRAIGKKVMNRNLSDCAAMACLPAVAVATVALPKGAGVGYAKELYLGMKEAGEKFGCVIVGGDTASWGGRLAVTVTILGRSDGIAPVTRGGARAGDHLYVTGKLGGTILGRHMTFEPRVAEARALASKFGVTAMIDLSDGLSRDLGHICRQSGVGAVVYGDRVPVHEDALRVGDGRPGLEHALHDGEDHELLFTSPERIMPDALGRGPAVSLIGEVVERPGVWLRTGEEQKPLLPEGWEHSL